MIRSIFAVLAGVLAGSFVVWVIDLCGVLLHPPPADFNFSDADALAAHVASAPLGAKLFVGLAWSTGPLVGAWLAARIARRAPIVHGLIVGAVFCVLNLMTILSFRHPLWLSVTSVVLPPVMSYAGALLARPPSSPPTSGPRPYDMREKNMAC